MENENHDKSVSRRVEAAIKSGQVKMRPQWHFVLKTTLAISGGLLVFLAILYLASLIIFISRQGGARIFLISLPWLLLLLTLIFVGILELLASHYPLIYHQPLLYSILAIIILAILGGYFLERTELHGRLTGYSERSELPLVSSFYRNIKHQREIRRCHEINISDDCSN